MLNQFFAPGGLLVRSPDDRGVIAVCDSRASTTRCGKGMLRMVAPGAPRTSRLEDVEVFFNSPSVITEVA